MVIGTAGREPQGDSGTGTGNKSMRRPKSFSTPRKEAFRAKKTNLYLELELDSRRVRKFASVI